ncbi:MAG: helix-turn-helix domain-containing protein [Bdellovibrionota bacterium]
MLYTYNMRKASENSVWDALANENRRQILDLLKEKPRTTGEIAMKLRGLDRCTVMLHLGVLTDAGLVIAKREGKFRWNYLNVEPIQRIYERWLSTYAQPAAALLNRLKDDLEVG